MPLDDDCKVVFVAGLSKMLGRAEASVREGIRRGMDWLPKSSKWAPDTAGLKRTFGNSCAPVVMARTRARRSAGNGRSRLRW